MHPFYRVALAGSALAIALSACNGNGSTTTATNTPGGVRTPQAFVLKKNITLPGVPPATGTFSFDIGFVDPAAGQYYLADRTTKGIDVIDLASLTYLRSAGAGTFTGLGTPAGAGVVANSGGPNGVVSNGSGILFAGDGDSTLKVLNANTGALLATVPNANPYSGPNLPAICGGSGAPTTGTANLRLDELALDPTDNVIFAVNDASCPPYGTFYSAAPPYNVIASIAFPTANAGAEQPTWDPGQKKFIMAFPATVANPGGEIDLIDPISHQITATLPEQSCNANGTALGKNETLFLGCSGTAQLLTINATNGATISSIPGVGGADEVWYNPTADRFYAASSNNLASSTLSGPFLVVTDGAGRLIASFPTSAGAHSVAVDPATENTFVPQRALGISVFSH